MSGSVQLSDTEFKYRFERDAILIKQGDYETSESQKITAFQCVDDITVFAVERERDKVKCIMAWRFCEGVKLKSGIRCNESIVDIQLKFHELIEPNADCHLYIVGGMMDTTVGKGRLLDRIRDAIYGYFTKPKLEVEIRVNESRKYGCQYVTAKIEMNGKLTDCYHN